MLEHTQKIKAETHYFNNVYIHLTMWRFSNTDIVFKKKL